MIRVTTYVTCGALALTSACSTTPTSSARVDPGQAQELVALCMDQTQAPGAYNWRFDGKLPVAMSLTKFGGTRSGAQMINACVRQNAVLYKTEPAATPANTTAAAPDPILSDPEPTPPSGVTPVAARKPAPTPTPTAEPAAAPRPVAGPSTGPGGCPPGITGLYRGTVIC
jgi:cell division septation protein DedD